MELSILDRLTLLNSLPGQGNAVDLKIVRKLRESLEFSEEEIDNYGIVATSTEAGTNFKWRQDVVRDIPIGEKASDIIVNMLKKLNGQNSLTNHHLSLWDKFIENNGG